MAQWYYAQNNQQFGPHDEGAMRNLLQNGTVQANDLVWRDGMANWIPAHSVPEFSTFFAHQQPVSGQVAQNIGYGQQPGYPPQHVGYATPYSSGVAPKSYLVEAILVTLCCCLPFGIAGIVYAAQVNSKFQAGDFAGAAAAAESAKKWVLIGFITGIIANVLIFGLQIAAEM
jgi:hypothetical protein